MKKDYLMKGVYDHYQLSGYLTVKQYMIVEQDGKRCLLLRFENEMSKTISAFAFDVKQLDAAGNEIGTIKLQYSDLQITGGFLYCPEKGIVIEKNCVDFVIRMRYVICGRIKYRFRKGRATAHYDLRGYADPMPSSAEGEKRRVVVNRQPTLKRKYFGWLSFVAFVLVVLAFAFLIYRSKDPFAGQKKLEQADVCVTEML